jgi:hypothetical protein
MENIPLSEFIALSIKSILEGIDKAREATSESGAIIAPKMLKDGSRGTTQAANVPHMVHFDVTVEVSNQGVDVSQGGSFNLGNIFQAGSNHERGTRENQSFASRLSFDIPIVFHSSESGKQE